MFLRTRDTPTLSSLASVGGSAQLARLTVTENGRRRTIALQDLAPRPRLVPPASAGVGIDAFSSIPDPSAPSACVCGQSPTKGSLGPTHRPGSTGVR